MRNVLELILFVTFAAFFGAFVGDVLAGLGAFIGLYLAQVTVILRDIRAAMKEEEEQKDWSEAQRLAAKHAEGPLPGGGYQPRRRFPSVPPAAPPSSH